MVIVNNALGLNNITNVSNVLSVNNNKNMGNNLSMNNNNGMNNALGVNNIIDVNKYNSIWVAKELLANHGQEITLFSPFSGHLWPPRLHTNIVNQD